MRVDGDAAGGERSGERKERREVPSRALTRRARIASTTGIEQYSAQRNETNPKALKGSSERLSYTREPLSKDSSSSFATTGRTETIRGCISSIYNSKKQPKRSPNNSCAPDFS